MSPTSASKTTLVMSKIETYARQCTIFIGEVYDLSGQMYVTTSQPE
jgi:hypothetical protein